MLNWRKFKSDRRFSAPGKIRGKNANLHLLLNVFSIGLLLKVLKKIVGLQLPDIFFNKRFIELKNVSKINTARQKFVAWRIVLL